jgi:hypothetical protein
MPRCETGRTVVRGRGAAHHRCPAVAAAGALGAGCPAGGSSAKAAWRVRKQRMTTAETRESPVPTAARTRRDLVRLRVAAPRASGGRGARCRPSPCRMFPAHAACSARHHGGASGAHVLPAHAARLGPAPARKHDEPVLLAQVSAVQARARRVCAPPAAGRGCTATQAAPVPAGTPMGPRSGRRTRRFWATRTRFTAIRANRRRAAYVTSGRAGRDRP